MELVSNISDEDIAKAKAKEDVENELTDFAINFLRVVAGAGRPWEVFRDMVACVNAAQAYREAHGCYPSSWEIAAALDGDKPTREWMDT